ncbi:carbohydrate ABC transporter permease [Paenarthrobacter sp. Z7-10]|uniref:carbohydrate ABC transporter permease n=1 Tax=Paenarthrobacter sp. Z7-10 TaxID=2787635 RepID=UPI0022A91323|nr:carbohydrate ABC transporter permease [Paenarthrobacter sp. Z7-10]MCZ2404692.1 carbohydrate ABC transporter permease [Paenarthrobacter sp. Z7-10]
MRIRRREMAFNYTVLIIFSAIAVIPLLGVLLSAVTPKGDPQGGFQLPSGLDLGNFVEAWNRGHFSTYMTSSALVTISVVVLTTIMSTLAGFAFARMDFPGKNALFFMLLAGLLLPAEAFIIPLYYNLRSAGITDTYWALILPQTAQSLAFGVFWMRNQFRTFPHEIMEAGRLDGASDWKLLWKVIVPPSIPAISTMCLLVAMWTWNEFLIPLIMVSSENLRTAPLGLAFFQGQHITDYSLLAAAGVIVALPIVLLYIFLQRRFISGMVNGISSR